MLGVENSVFAGGNFQPPQAGNLVLLIAKKERPVDRLSPGHLKHFPEFFALKIKTGGPIKGIRDEDFIIVAYAGSFDDLKSVIWETSRSGSVHQWMRWTVEL